MLTFDGLGNGASDRPTDPAYYADEAFAADAARVMEAAGIERAVVMSSSLGAAWQLLLAYRYPQRVAGFVYIVPALPLAGGEWPWDRRLPLQVRPSCPRPVLPDVSLPPAQGVLSVLRPRHGRRGQPPSQGRLEFAGGQMTRGCESGRCVSCRISNQLATLVSLPGSLQR